MNIFLPFYYTLYTRLKSKTSRVAWIFTYVFPVLLTSYILNIDFIFSFVLIILIYSAYEIGYIFNDCEVIKNEENPTLRLTRKELNSYENKKNNIFLIRFLFLVLELSIIYFFFKDMFLASLLSVLFILILYVPYNYLRNNWNIPLYSLLVLARYFSFFLFLEGSFLLCFALWVSYPLCVTIEFSTKNRFFTSSFIKIKNPDRFRVIYYIILVLFSLFFCNFVESNYTLLLLVLSVFFLIYRSLALVLMSKKYRNK